MPTNYPTSLDSLANPGLTTRRNDPGFELDLVISTLNDIAEALEAKLGIASSTPADGQVLRADATGATRWDTDSVVELAPNGGQDLWGSTTSFSIPQAVDTPTVPRWVSRREHVSDNLTVAQETAIIDPSGGRYATRLAKTGANGLASHRYNVPTAQVADWRGRTVSLRARVRQGVASNVRVSIHDGALASSPTQTTTGAFTTYTVTRTISPTATAIWLGLELGVSAFAADTVYLDNVSVSWGATPTVHVPSPPPVTVNKATFYNSASQAIGDSALVPLNLNATYENIGGFAVTSSSRVSVPENGWYLVTAAFEYQPNVSGWRTIALRVNGASFVAVDRRLAASATVETSVHIADLVYLRTTDYIEVCAQHNAGTTISINNSAGLLKENHVSLVQSP